jgi:tRNA A-37 threonylcarbamoyl transferase component Bud32
MFYITDKSTDHDLNSHLLDARKLKCWISNRELITMVADAVDAVSFLHSKQVVHRNLTTYAFSLRRKNIVLHDFSVAEIIDKITGFISGNFNIADIIVNNTELT